MEQLSVPGILASHDAMIAFLERQTELAGLDPKASYRLHLAVDEIVANIITHGYEENGLTGDILLTSEIRPETFVFTLEDGSPPFDPRTLAKPASLDQSLEDRPIGGLGIFLMLRSVDAFDYTYIEGRNRNILTMNRSANPVS